ncbi:MAG: TonB-dependent receptor [Crocinitomicaceae bacterium]|nr:TonB-dependent receptor [Crocinitomicaceae bacterium]
MKRIHFSLTPAIFVGFVTFCANIVDAQVDSSNFHTEKELIPIEIKAIRVNNKNPFAISNIDSLAIRRSDGVQDIPYLLDQTPSVTVTSDAGAGVGYTALRIRGTDAARINFTMNGIPVNDAESQAAIFVDFPDILGSANSIQIQRGVGSSTNGSGAFGASVNMSNLQQGNKAYASIHSAVGSFKTFKNSIKAGTGLLRGGFQFDLRLSKINSDGYIERAKSDLKSLQFIAGWTSKNEKSSLRFNLLLGREKTGQAWNGVPQDSLKTNRKFNGLGLMENGEYYTDQTDNYGQDYYQLIYNQQISDYWSGNITLFMTRGKGYYNEYQLGALFEDYNHLPFISPSNDTLFSTNLTRQLWLDNYFYGTTYSAHYQKNKTTLDLGGSISLYDGRHYGYVKWAEYGFPVDYSWYRLSAFKNDYSVFAKWQQQLGMNFYLFTDLQYRHVDYKMNGFRASINTRPNVQYDFLNPKIGLSYIKNHANANKSKVFTSFAMAQKEPNRNDFEAATYELPKPETLYDVELGYEFHAFNWGFGLNMYYMHYNNQLILTGKLNDVGAYARQNVPTSYRSGIEIMANYQPIQMLSFVANATFSMNKIRRFTEYIDDYDNGGQIEIEHTNTTIGYSPSVIAYASATIEPFIKFTKNQHFYIDIIGKYISRQFLDNTSNTQRSINPYALANTRLRYTLETKKFIKELGISLSLNNLLNKMYESNGYTFSYQYGGERITENFYYPQAGFNFIFGVQLNF